jgi:UDP-glucose 4-epimerase
MDDSPTVLVTGSSGMIGTALVERLLADDTDVRGVDRRANRWSEAVDAVTERVDLLDPNASAELPADADHVVHLAAHSRVRDLVEDPSGAEENLRTLTTILEYARQVDADVIFTSSREVYGEQGHTVYAEADVGPRDVKNPYGASKIGGEALMASYNECYDLRTCTLRLSNVYGRYDDHNRVIPTFISLADRGEDLTVYGGDKLLDFLYIDDCVDALVAAIERINAVRGEVLNVGSGEGYSLLHLAEMIIDRVGADIDVSVDPALSGEVDRFTADIKRARRLMGFEPSHPLPEGLDETIGWYRDRPDLLDDVA